MKNLSGFINSLEEKEGFSNDKEVDEANKSITMRQPSSKDDVKSTKAQREFINRINKKIFKALNLLNASRDDVDKVELFMAITQDANGNFIITKAALVPQGGEFYIGRNTSFVAHWHHSGLERYPGKGDFSPTYVSGIPNFTITYNRKGLCCNVFEVGRFNQSILQRRIKRNSSVGDWRKSKYHSLWNK